MTESCSRLDAGLLVVILLPAFAAIALLQPGLPRTADGFLHLLRVVELDQAWRDGIYYPRWAPDMAFGYGYPIFNYFAPLLYHVTEIVHVMGFGFETSLKLVLMGCLLLGGWGTYALTKDILGPQAGILAAALYVYAPSTLRELYVRGGYAQYFAVALMPATLWSFNRLITREDARYLLTSSLLCGAVIVSHNISGMLFLFFLLLFLVWTICSLQRWHRIKHAVLAIFLALLLSSVFVLPALSEKPLVKLDRLTEGYFDFQQHFLTVGEILSPSVVPDSSSLNPVWLHNLGTAQVPLAILGLVALVVSALAARRRVQAAFFPAMLLICTFMTLPVSAPLWKHVPLLAFTEYPWRFLDIAVPATAVLGGASMHLWSRLRWRHLTSALLALSLVFTIATAFVHLYVQWPAARQEDLSAQDVILHEVRTGIVGTTSASECLPTSVVEEPTGSPLVAQYLSSSPISKLDDESLPDFAQAELLAHTVVSDEYRTVAPEPFTARFNTFYFPGWQAFVDGEAVPTTASYPRGLITLEVPAGEHQVSVRFSDTPVRTLGNLVSGAGLLLIVGLTLVLGTKGRARVPASAGVDANHRLPLPQACLLAMTLVMLLAVKRGIIDHRTTWFRRSSPPGQVLGVQHPSRISLGDQVVFLGYDASSTSVAPGDTLSVNLYWQAERRLQEDYSAFVHLDDLRASYISWSLSEQTNPADIPTSTWTPGFYVRDRHVLNISPETSPGLYVLRAGLYRPDDGERLPVLDGHGNAVSDTVELARIRVNRTTPVDVSGATMVGPYTFGDNIRLLGCRLEDTTATPGNYFRLVLYWRALAEMSQSYTIFVHLMDEDGQTWAQADGLPVEGMYPTWAWLQGEIVEDEHLVLLEKSVPPGRYRLAIGVYELDDLTRLKVTGPEGQLLGDQVLLETPMEVLSP